jgi:hypothetical protein
VGTFHGRVAALDRQLTLMHLKGMAMRFWGILFCLMVLGGFTLAQQRQEEKATDATPIPTQEKVEIKSVPQVVDQQQMSFWMAQKLVYSKALLESLTMGDFDRLAEDAKQMRLLGKIEGFVRRKNADYRMQVNTFDVALQQLIASAEEEEIQGATTAFNQMTSSCVACHALLRKGID